MLYARASNGIHKQVLHPVLGCAAVCLAAAVEGLLLRYCLEKEFKNFEKGCENSTLLHTAMTWLLLFAL